jgi:hypothetical protein
MARTARYLKYDGRKKQFVQTDPPLKYATALSVKDEWKFAPLLATIETPTLRDDGSILQRLGYDEESALYFDTDVRFPDIPTNPSKDEAIKALRILREPLKDFPFVGMIKDKDNPAPEPATSAEAVALAAILTALVRRSLPTAPLFMFDAPVSSSGKTLLARLIAVIATGREPTTVTYTKDPEESRKKIFSNLIAGDAVILLDNVSEPLEGDTLCAVLTSPEYSDRLLSSNTIIRVPTCVTFLATGNNLRTRGDMRTRCLACRIDPAVENPEEREFNYDLMAKVAASRPQLVAAALTIMRAYIVAGRPQVSPPLKAYGRFEAWSEMVRAPLVWLGCKDPCATREQIQDDDAEAEILSALLVALYGHFEGSIFTVSELVKAAKSRNQDMFEDGAADTAAALREAISPFDRNGEVNAKAVGNIFRSYKERIISCDGSGGKLSLRIRPVGKRHGSVTWRVERPPMARDKA